MVYVNLPLARVDEEVRVAMSAVSSKTNVSVCVVPASERSLSSYNELCKTAICGPAQGDLWVSNWIVECPSDSIIAMLYAADRPVLALPIEIVRRGPFRVAQLVGGRHANGNFPAVSSSWETENQIQSLRLLLDSISKHRPDIDLISLSRLLPELDNKPNPFLVFPSFASPNVALAVDLAGGFDELLQRPNGVHKLKKHRSQARKIGNFGTYSRLEAKTPEDIVAFLDAFFAMKDARFRKMGIANVFFAPEIRSFFHQVFSDALKQPLPPFVLHGLEVGGKLRAVTGSSRCGDRLVCEFGSIADDELMHISPGGFLFFDNIREACEQGFGIYDFSVGDEPYKRSWCDLEIQHRDVILPLTMKGRALAFVLHQKAKVTSYIKNNPIIWHFMKRARRKAIGQSDT